MKTIVTGGCGFIGSHLVERLLSEGHEVLVIDNLATGRRENLRAVERHPRLRLHLATLSQPEEYAGEFRDAECVFHVAGLAGVSSSLEWPWVYYQANVAATIGALEAARGAKVARFIYAASASCYGLPTRVPTTEQAALRPEVPYAYTKMLGEECVLYWARTYGLSVVSLRLFNVFGPPSRMNSAYGSVFGTFLAQKIQSKPFTVVGDGRQTRDYVHVTDVVDAFLRAAESGHSGTAYNVGSGEEHSVLDIARLLGGPVVHVPRRPGEPRRSCADITRIRRELGWEPKVRFEDGVREILSRIEELRETVVWIPQPVTQDAYERTRIRPRAGRA